MGDTNSNIFRSRGLTSFGKHSFRNVTAYNHCRLDDTIYSGWGCNYPKSCAKGKCKAAFTLKELPNGNVYFMLSTSNAHSWVHDCGPLNEKSVLDFEVLPSGTILQDGNTTREFVCRSLPVQKTHTKSVFSQCESQVALPVDLERYLRAFMENPNVRVVERDRAKKFLGRLLDGSESSSDSEHSGPEEDSVIFERRPVTDPDLGIFIGSQRIHPRDDCLAISFETCCSKDLRGSHQRKYHMVGEVSLPHYVFVAGPDVVEPTSLDRFKYLHWPAEARFSSLMAAQIIDQIYEIPLPRDAVWTPVDAGLGSFYEISNLLSHKDPRLQRLLSCILKYAVFPLHSYLCNIFGKLRFVDCSLFGVQSDSSEVIPLRYVDEPGKEKKTLSVVLTLSGEGHLSFYRFRNRTVFHLDVDYMCVFHGNILYQPEQKSSDPWIWLSMRLANVPGDFPVSRGHIPAEDDPNIPEGWKPPEIVADELDPSPAAKKRKTTRGRK
jgi:hypothetical protein